jgi:hypothetical protein
MNTVRASGATSESMATTFTPRVAACLSAGATALGSLPAMMRASGFCWTTELMSGTCEDAPASVGPTMRSLPPSSVSAFWTPPCSISSYGFPSCLGIETVFRPFLIVADASAAAVDFEAPELPDDSLSLLVDPQADTTRASAMAASAAMRTRTVRMDIMLFSPPVAVTWYPWSATATGRATGTNGHAPPARGPRDWAPERTR